MTPAGPARGALPGKYHCGGEGGGCSETDSGFGGGRWLERSSVLGAAGKAREWSEIGGE